MNIPLSDSTRDQSQPQDGALRPIVEWVDEKALSINSRPCLFLKIGSLIARAVAGVDEITLAWGALHAGV